MTLQGGEGVSPYAETRWGEFYTMGKSGGGGYSIAKARMSRDRSLEYQAREYLTQAVRMLDKGEGTRSELEMAQRLVSAAFSELSARLQGFV